MQQLLFFPLPAGSGRHANLDTGAPRRKGAEKGLKKKTNRALCSLANRSACARRRAAVWKMAACLGGFPGIYGGGGEALDVIWRPLGKYFFKLDDLE